MASFQFNPFTKNLDLVGTSGGGASVTSVTGSNGVTASPTTGAVVVSGVNATTSTVGVASFNPADFTVNGSGEVSTIGGAAITVINGNTGSISGSTVTIEASNAGESVAFNNSGTVSQFVLTDANSNTFLGANCGAAAATFNTGVGDGCMSGATSGTTRNTAFGISALQGSISTDNVAIGYHSGIAITTATANTAVGASSLASNILSGENTAIGYAALGNFVGPGGFEGLNVAIGAAALDGAITGTNNIGIGALCGSNWAGAESNNIIIGNAGVVSEANTTRIGTQGSGAGQQNKCFIAGITGVTVSNQQFVIIDSTTGQLGVVSSTGAIVTIDGDTGSATGSTVNVIANTASNLCGASVKFTASASSVVLSVTDPSHNVFIGQSSGNATVSGANNSAQGYLTMPSATTADSNCCLGSTSLGSLLSGSNNVAMGVIALSNLTTGDNCIGIGRAAGQSYTSSESNNICIGSSTTGTTGESNTTRIGNGSTAACFVTGISGVTVTGTAVLCATNGQLGTVVSSKRYKENIKPMGKDISVMHLRPKEFNYKFDEKRTTKYGLVAEEVHEDFPELCFYNENDKPESVLYHELPVFLLHEIKKLNDRIEKLENKRL